MSIRIDYAPMNNAPTTAESATRRLLRLGRKAATMSEYIVRMPPDMPYEIKAELNAWYVESEPIVRCRDCKHFCEDRRDTSIGWVDVFVCVSEQWSTTSLMPSHKVEPNGFCAWAEREEKG